MTTRRDFLKLIAAAGGAMLLGNKTGAIRKVFAMPLPGGTLDPLAIPKYQMPLIIPPAMPRTGKVKVRKGKNIDFYQIAVRQFQQQILPTGMPQTTVLGVWALKAPGTVAQGGSFQLSIVYHRSKMEYAGAGGMDQRS